MLPDRVSNPDRRNICTIIAENIMTRPHATLKEKTSQLVSLSSKNVVKLTNNYLVLVSLTSNSCISSKAVSY